MHIQKWTAAIQEFKQKFYQKWHILWIREMLWNLKLSVCKSHGGYRENACVTVSSFMVIWIFGGVFFSQNTRIKMKNGFNFLV